MNWGMLPLMIWMRTYFQSAIRNSNSAIGGSAILVLLALSLSGCETTSPGPGTGGDAASRAALQQSIANEAPGDYWIGRRYYNANYKFWGYIRRPRESWKSARLVVLNEQAKFSPDRALNTMGIDNNSEYKIQGRFTGETIYESASNAFYPEFVATSFQLLSTNPTSIFPVGYRASAVEIVKPDL
jgi:hypothetical protein